MTYLTLRLLHLLFMAGWFGSMLFFAGDLRRTLAAGETHHTLMRDRLSRMDRTAAIMGILTLLTGFALIFALGGFGEVPVPIHIGMTLGLAAWGVGAVGIGGGWRQLDAVLQDGGPQDKIDKLRKRIAASTGIFHLLWLITLVLMVYRNVLLPKGG